MLILTLNCGSSSFKCQIYDNDKGSVAAKASVERIGLSDPIINLEVNGNKTKITDAAISGHKSAIEETLNRLQAAGAFKSIKEIGAAGHRIVHGGDLFNHSIEITDEVIKAVESVSYLAPLHNPANIEGIKALQSMLPDIPHVAVFDTAFHQSIPEKAYRYALPKEWYDKYKVRRYGFHGTSHLYVSKRAAKMLGKPADQCNLIILHVGNGASVTAIKNGLSVDTSMGMTPLEGVIMGTRCGDIDPSIPAFMVKMTGKSIAEIDDMLYKKSGILGITEKYSDRRDIEANADKDPLCKLALEMECYRLKKYIGMYCAVLNRVDAIVFTGGVGENSATIRGMAAADLDGLGIKVDNDKNHLNIRGEEREISCDSSKVKVFIIPTDEEIVLTEDVLAVLKKEYKDHIAYPYSFL